MYLHIGKDFVIRTQNIIGIFDLDNTGSSPRTKAFFKQAEQEGAVISVDEDIPKSYILTDWPASTTLYLSRIGARPMSKRAANPEKSLLQK